MAKLSEHIKAILIVVLKLVLMILKKSDQTSIHRTKEGWASCFRKRSTAVSSADKNENTDSSFSTMTSTPKLCLSSGMGSSICSTESHNTSRHEEEFFESPNVCSLEDKIERLRTENRGLREKLSQKQIDPRKNLVYRSKTSLSQAISSTPRSTASEDDDMHDVVREKLKLKLELEKEENTRLQNYINDVMYMVLETRPSLLEK